MKAIKGRMEEMMTLKRYQNTIKKNSSFLTVVMERRKYYVIGGKK
jgi:hypothetical protein